LKQVFTPIMAFLLFLSATTTTPSQRRRAPKRSTSAAKVAEQTAATAKQARERVAAQLKTLTHFLYLYGGIAKGIESADQATRGGDGSASASEINERNKVKVKESIRNVRDGLDRFETDFRSNQTWRSYHPYVSGVTRIGEVAESQAAANRFDEAGRSLLKAVNQLADALALMR
jgi:hypothetical protein